MEHKSQPLASRFTFFKRMLRTIMFSFSMITICLLIGVMGYHYSDHVSWLDALHNASMILSGMGPVITIESDLGKYFSSFYALFSGIVFISNIGLLLAPVAHRIYHRLHIDA